MPNGITTVHVHYTTKIVLVSLKNSRALDYGLVFTSITVDQATYLPR